MTDYRTYLQSPQWRIKKIGFCEATNWKCQQCGADHWLGAGLQIHHLHYKSLGRELPRDVRVLCARCHEAAHAAQPER